MSTAHSTSSPDPATARRLPADSRNALRSLFIVGLPLVARQSLAEPPDLTHPPQQQGSGFRRYQWGTAVNPPSSRGYHPASRVVTPFGWEEPDTAQEVASAVTVLYLRYLPSGMQLRP